VTTHNLRVVITIGKSEEINAKKEQHAHEKVKY